MAGPRHRGTTGGEIFGRLTRLALKELRETLRDRRTIITLVVMPLVLYPILALVFQRFLLTSLTSQGDGRIRDRRRFDAFQDAAGRAAAARRGGVASGAHR